MKNSQDFTEGKILLPLLRFAMPCSTIIQILLCFGCMAHVKSIAKKYD